MEPLRWMQLMSRLGLDDNIDTYDKLISNYKQKHRHYHDVNHIKAVLEHLDNAKYLASDCRAVEFALWFHDAIYNVFSSKNELDSANWASSFLLANGINNEFSNKVHALVMATCHNTMPIDQDEKLIVDIDLSILGSSPKTYNMFEEWVRKEYKIIPKFIYNAKRKAILTSFLERDRIYFHDYFYEKLERGARINLTHAIRVL